MIYQKRENKIIEKFKNYEIYNIFLNLYLSHHEKQLIKSKNKE
jgi:hypothetical protein